MHEVPPEARRPQLARPRQQVARQVPVGEAQDEVAGDPDGEDPGEGQVPAPRQRQVVARRDRRPAGKRLALPLAVDAEHPGRVDRQLPDPQVASAAVLADLEPGRVGVGAVLAPVEPRVGVEDHQPAHQHDDEGHDVDPVPDPGRQPVPAHDTALAGRRGAGGSADIGHGHLLPGAGARGRPERYSPVIALHRLAEHHVRMLGARGRDRLGLRVGRHRVRGHHRVAGGHHAPARGHGVVHGRDGRHPPVGRPSRRSRRSSCRPWRPPARAAPSSRRASVPRQGLSSSSPALHRACGSRRYGGRRPAVSGRRTLNHDRAQAPGRISHIRANGSAPSPARSRVNP